MIRLVATVLATTLLAVPALAQIQSRDTGAGSARGQVETAQSRQAEALIAVENRMGPGVVVFALFLSASDDHRWGQDRLGDNVLLPGASLRTTVHGDCARQDVRIQVMHQDARGRGPTGEIIRRGIDVCAGLRLSPDLAWRIEIPT